MRPEKAQACAGSEDLRTFPSFACAGAMSLALAGAAVILGGMGDPALAKAPAKAPAAQTQLTVTTAIRRITESQYRHAIADISGLTSRSTRDSSREAQAACWRSEGRPFDHDSAGAVLRARRVDLRTGDGPEDAPGASAARRQIRSSLIPSVQARSLPAPASGFSAGR